MSIAVTSYEDTELWTSVIWKQCHPDNQLIILGYKLLSWL